MFHWICPECGQEIAPGVKECPVCDPQASAAPLPSNGPLATVMSPREATPIAKTPEPAVVLQPEIIQQPEVLQPKLSAPEEILEPEILQPEVVVAKSEAPLPAIPESRVPEPETFSDRLADLAERLHGQRMPYGSPRIIESVAVPRQETERVPVILDLTPARPLLAAPPSMRLLAEPQPPSIAVEFPASQVFKPQAVAPGRPLERYRASRLKPRHPPQTPFSFPSSQAAPQPRH